MIIDITYKHYPGEENGSVRFKANEKASTGKDCIGIQLTSGLDKDGLFNYTPMMYLFPKEDLPELIKFLEANK